MDKYNPDYVIILSGDHIYKMDYQLMLDYHKANKADLTIACMTVPWEEASRFGIMIADEFGRITEFEEKPANPRSNLASMGIYIFNYDVLRSSLESLNKDYPNLDFGMHVLPHIRENGGRIFAYEFSGYWKDVGTLGSYWESNMELVDIVPEFNLYEEFWKIYTNIETTNPQYIAEGANIDRTLISSGCEIYGDVYNSVLGFGVKVGKGTVVRDSIIMNGVVIGENSVIEKSIIAEETIIGNGVKLGEGEAVPNVEKPKIYGDGIVTIGERSVIPDGVTIGKNTAVYGVTYENDYNNMQLPSGGYLVKEGE
mgnify:FL=1